MGNNYGLPKIKTADIEKRNKMPYLLCHACGYTRHRNESRCPACGWRGADPCPIQQNSKRIG